VAARVRCVGQAVSAWTVGGVGVESAGLTAAGRITPAQAVEVETCSTTTQRVGREALPYWWPWCSRSFCFCFAGSGGLRASRMCHRTHLAACLQSFPSRACAAALVEKALGITGDSILYVGDHICEQGEDSSGTRSRLPHSSLADLPTACLLQLLSALPTLPVSGKPQLLFLPDRSLSWSRFLPGFVRL
jgi:hypothetical protein